MNAASRKAYEAGRADALAGRDPDPDHATPGADEFAYDNGFAAGLEELGDSSSDAPRRRRSTSSSSTRRPASRRSSSGSRRRRSTASRRAAKAVTAPVSRQVGSAISVLGTAVLIAFLYNLLTHTDSASGAIGGLAAALRWLDDPTKSIPYRKT